MSEISKVRNAENYNYTTGQKPQAADGDDHECGYPGRLQDDGCRDADYETNGVRGGTTTGWRGTGARTKKLIF